MKMVICLGNPGTEYAKTRHNAGFMFADALSKKLLFSFSNEKKFKAHTAKTEYNKETLLIVKPQTYMNLSGETLSALLNFYKTDIKTIFLVFDDIALDLGRIRFRSSGSAGGHNGVKSIIKHLGTDSFCRLKIGIGPQPEFIKSEDYVLQKFKKEEEETLKNVINTSIDAFLYYMEYGLEKAQNKYNN